MADSELTVLVKTLADTYGAEEVQKALKGISSATGDAVKETKKLTFAKGDLRKIVGTLSRDFPLLGMAMRAALSPVTAIVIAATMAFRYFKKEIDETNKKLDELEHKAAGPIGDMKVSLIEAAAAVAKHRREYEEYVSKLVNVTQQQKKAYDDELAKIKDVEAATLRLIDAKVKAGLLAPSAAPAAKQRAETAAMVGERGRREAAVAGLETAYAGAVAGVGAGEKRLADVKQVAREMEKVKTLAQLMSELAEKREWMKGPEAAKVRQQIDELAGQKTIYTPGGMPITRGATAQEQAQAAKLQEQFSTAQLERQIKAMQDQVIAIEDANAALARLKQVASDIGARLETERAGLKGVTMSPEMAGSVGLEKVNEFRATFQEFAAGGINQQELVSLRMLFNEMLAYMKTNKDLTAASRTALGQELERMRRQVEAVAKNTLNQ